MSVEDSNEWWYQDGDMSWINENGDLRISVDEVQDELIIQLERTVSADGYQADVTTLVLRAKTIDQATELVEQIMDEIEDGENTVTAVGAEPGDVGDTTFIHFYCVFDELLPDAVDAENILFLGDEEESDDAVETISAYDVEEETIEESDNIRVEIYPVHESNVSYHE